jgi:membrane protease YdiL (CAAX protease family)
VANTPLNRTLKLCAVAAIVISVACPAYHNPSRTIHIWPAGVALFLFGMFFGWLFERTTRR